MTLGFRVSGREGTFFPPRIDFLLDCCWVGFSDFNFLGKQVVFSTKPHEKLKPLLLKTNKKLQQLFAEGSTNFSGNQVGFSTKSTQSYNNFLQRGRCSSGAFAYKHMSYFPLLVLKGIDHYNNFLQRGSITTGNLLTAAQSKHENETLRARARPGAMVLLRADCLTHRFTSRGAEGVRLRGPSRIVFFFFF